MSKRDRSDRSFVLFSDEEQLSNSNTGCYVGCATLGGISVQEGVG